MEAMNVQIQGCHIKGHDEHPRNEMADAICRTLSLKPIDILAAVQPQHIDAEVSAQMMRQNAALLPWMYVSVLPIDRRAQFLVDTDGSITEAITTQPQIYAVTAADLAYNIDNTVAYIDSTGDTRLRPTNVGIGSHNALTMRKRGKRSIFAKALLELKIWCFGMQECRSREEGMTEHGEYYVMASAADDKGNYGCEVWLCKSLPIAKSDDKTYVVRVEDIVAVVAEPRRPFVHVDTAVHTTLCCSCHAPHEDCGDDFVLDWWTTTCNLIGLWRGQRSVILCCDTNIDPGGHGGHAPKVYKHRELLQSLLHKHKLYIPAQQEALRKEQARDERATFVKVGAEATTDFVILSTDIKVEPESVEVLTGFPVLNKGYDHVLTALKATVPVTSATSLAKRKVAHYDRVAAANPTPEQHKQMEWLLFFPPLVPACYDNSSHMHILDEWMVDCACIVYPRVVRQRLEDFVTDATVEEAKRCQMMKMKNRSWARQLTAMRFIVKFWSRRTRSNTVWDAVRGPAPKWLCMDAALLSAATNDACASLDQSIARDFAQRVRTREKEMQAAFDSGDPRRMHDVVHDVMRRKESKIKSFPAVFDEHGVKQFGLMACKTIFRGYFGKLMDAVEVTFESVIEEDREYAAKHIDAVAQIPMERNCVPDRAGIGRRNRRYKFRKAIDEAGLRGELQRWHSDKIAAATAPLDLKMSVRCQAPIQHKGAFMTELWKKNLSQIFANAYRDVTCGHMQGKAVTGHLRTQAQQPLEHGSHATQFGSGLHGGGTDFTHLHVRCQVDWAQLKECCLGQLFLDVQTAFARMCRSLALGQPDNDEALLRRMRHCGMTDHAITKVCDKLRRPTVWAECEGGSPHLEELQRDRHRGNWSSAEYIPFVLKHDNGTTAGNATADIIFSCAMTCMITDVREEVDAAGLVELIPDTVQDEFHPGDEVTEEDRKIREVSYIDDTEQPVYGHANEIIDRIIRTVQIWVKVAESHGMTLNFDQGKSELQIHYFGPGSGKLRHEVENALNNTIVVRISATREIHLRVVRKYRHVGSQSTSAATMHEEIIIRAGLMRETMAKIAGPILCDQTLDMSSKRLILLLYTCTRTTFQAGTWPTLKPSEHARIHATLMTAYRKCLPKKHERIEGAFYSDDEVFALTGMPAPFTLLVKHRMQLFLRVVTKAPVAITLLVSAPKNAVRSWWKAVSNDTNWIIQQSPEYQGWRQPEEGAPLFVGGRSCVPLSTWMAHFRQDPKAAKQKFNKALLADEISKSEKWQHAPGGSATVQGTYYCSVCAAMHTTKAAPVLHEWRGHGVQRSLRRKINTTWCAVCMQDFQTYERVIVHAYRSLRCNFVYSVCYDDIELMEQLEVVNQTKADTKEIKKAGHNHKNAKKHANKVVTKMFGPLTEQAMVAGVHYDNRLRTGKRQRATVDDMADNLRQHMDDSGEAQSPPRPITAEDRARIGFNRLVAMGRQLIARPPARWRAQRGILVLCSGYAGDDDIATYFELEADKHGLALVALRIDPAVQRQRDLCDRTFFCGIEALVRSDIIVGVWAAPPCSTVSKRRHKQLLHQKGEPRPLRSRAKVMQALPGRSARERAQVLIGSHLWSVCMHAVSLAAALAKWNGLENPADAGEPYPTFWLAAITTTATEALTATLTYIDQCQYGATIQKETTVWTTSTHLTLLHRTCKCSQHEFVPVITKDSNGKKVFASAEMARYPSRFAEAIAKSCIAELRHPSCTPSLWRPTVNADMFPFGLAKAVQSCREGKHGWQL